MGQLSNFCTATLITDPSLGEGFGGICAEKGLGFPVNSALRQKRGGPLIGRYHGGRQRRTKRGMIRFKAFGLGQGA
jgi:hypothetical protein